ncbi:MAG: alpha/beta hydrolase family protein [Thermoplasmatota archaeon]
MNTHLEDLDPVTSDPPFFDEEFPSGLDHLNIDSDGSNMLGVLFRPQGEGPHPTAVILHGFPGHERNLDLAHVLQRAGWNAVVFHYRGAWGSEGSFSFSNMLEDVNACVEHLRSEEWESMVDRRRISLIGHSIGGWAAMMTASEDPDILEVASLAGFDLGGMRGFLMQSEMVRRLAVASFADLVKPLKCAGPEELVREIVDMGERWRIPDSIGGMLGTRILIIGASRDQIAIPEHHHDPLSRAVAGRDDLDVTIDRILSDHNFSDRRIALSGIVLHWLREGSGKYS